MPLEQLTRVGSVRPIRRWDDPALHQSARAVLEFDDELQWLLADMFATNTAASGAGLAAPHDGRLVRAPHDGRLAQTPRGCRSQSPSKRSGDCLSDA